ncbi:hypothetical protein BDB00DRAFT_851091 [Zychaea mexicana]|uniref:uncharacterized protein n=1 Tax=Zychaea mexicana TaxID=64656 RepID=UPI0022FE5E6B|nr:uncharacterized protein BDB00DRAFT_851091 [Zychaea mexicana]KAI9487934.1 hypothetical protein BDB00DRAFT_851091 [Zychaea mexicana]
MDAPGSSKRQDYQYQHHSSSSNEGDLPQPILPWVLSSGSGNGGNVDRHSAVSTLSRSSVDTTAAGSVHLVKRNIQDPTVKRKMRWSSFKWWILMTNSLFEISNTYKKKSY